MRRKKRKKSFVNVFLVIAILAAIIYMFVEEYGERKIESQVLSENNVGYFANKQINSNENQNSLTDTGNDKAIDEESFGKINNEKSRDFTESNNSENTIKEYQKEQVLEEYKRL